MGDAPVTKWTHVVSGATAVKGTGRKTFAANIDELGAIQCDGESSWWILWHTIRPDQSETLGNVCEYLMGDIDAQVGGWGSIGLQEGFIGHAWVPIKQADGGCNFFCIWEIRPERKIEEIDPFFYKVVFPQFVNHNFFQIDSSLVN